MPKFSANLSMLFPEVPFLERFDRAARAGFSAVEYQFPYAHDRRDLMAAQKDAKLPVVLHNLPAGSAEAGDRGLACHPDRTGEFRESLAVAIDYAKAVGCRRLHCLAGLVGDGISKEALARTYVDNLRSACLAGQRHGIEITIEPLNTRDFPGYFLRHTRQALEIIGQAEMANLSLQYDCYHMQIMEGDLAHTIARVLPKIGHIQIADSPGRNEPGTGEINYEFLLDHIDRLGYRFWVGVEYKPAGDTDKGLAWYQRYRPFQPQRGTT